MATDWSGRKYRVLKRLGENIDMVFGVYQPQAGMMRWFLHSHEVDDGGGAIVKIMASLGVSLPPKAHKSIPPRPGIPGRLAALSLHLRLSRSVDIPWRIGPASEREAAPHFSYVLCSRQQSELARAGAARLGVGETSLFLSALDQVCRERLLTETCERVWMLPHDFRRSLNIRTQHGNWTAPVSLRLSGEPTPQDIYQGLRRLYDQGILWGAWTYTNFARWLTEGMIRRAYHRLRHRAWFGVYANMGQWQASGLDSPASAEPAGLPGSWVISAPPLSAVCPVTAGSFTWAGQTGFTLQIHPRLRQRASDVTALMHAWVSEIHRRAGIESSDEHTGIRVQCIPMRELVGQASRVDAGSLQMEKAT